MATVLRLAQDRIVHQTLKAASLSGDIVVFGTGDIALVRELKAAGYPDVEGMSPRSRGPLRRNIPRRCNSSIDCCWKP